MTTGVVLPETIDRTKQMGPIYEPNCSVEERTDTTKEKAEGKKERKNTSDKDKERRTKRDMDTDRKRDKEEREKERDLRTSSMKSSLLIVIFILYINWIRKECE